jgi:hypothetical protein
MTAYTDSVEYWTADDHAGAPAGMSRAGMRQTSTGVV